MMMPPARPNVKSEREPFFSNVLEGSFQPAELFFAIMVKRFQKLAAEWLQKVEYARMELRRFGKEFLRAPIAYLDWLKAGKPKEQARQRPRRNGAFLQSFFSLDAPL